MSEPETPYRPATGRIGPSFLPASGLVLALVVALALCAGIARPAAADEAETGALVFGTWRSEDGDAHIRLMPCAAADADASNEELCGYIVWLEEPFDAPGQPDLDDENPDPALRSRPVLGLKILEGFAVTPDSRGRYTDGSIYDPDSGKTYSAQLTPDGETRLKLRGYVGISLLGRTSEWTRVKRPAPGTVDPTKGLSGID